MTDQVKAEVDQIWETKDKRESGRRVVVLRIEGEKALVSTCSPYGDVQSFDRQSRISLDRDGALRGYRFVDHKPF